MPLNEYTTGNVIGKGTYGEVSLVKHKRDRKQYVIKRVDIHNASKREQKAAELEAKLLSQVRHPNIVSYKESFQGDDGFLYIVMAFCEGGDMYSRLKAQKGTYLEERQIVEWFVQIAMALQYLHDRHILHRDLKTQNIFLTKSKIIKVGDLGIAKVLENASDMATTLIGTPYYMSPELFSNKPYSYKSDVWALGCCLYEMCTLKHAFNAKDMNSLVYKILKGKLPAMPKIYSDDLCDIIRSMLGQDPEKRPSVARLLRHSFIKKQIALFLEGTKNRQKKNLKAKEAQEQASTSESSKTSDSGYSGMDSREDPKTSDSARSKQTGKDERGQRRKSSDVNSNEQVVKQKVEGHVAPRSKVSSHEERQAKEANENLRSEQKSLHGGRKSKEGRTTEDDGRTGSSDRQQSSRSRPLPPKPPGRDVDPGNNANPKSNRERRRYKVSKQAEEKEKLAENPRNSSESVGHVDLKPRVSSGNPTSARERRRQRERESMGKAQSVLPASLSSEKISGSPTSSDIRVRSSSQNSSVDVTDGPTVTTPSSEKIEKPKYGGSVDNHSSDDTDTEENSQEDAGEESKKKPRRKESSEVNSLISALDTTLKFTEDSPELDQETQEEDTDEPGDISVSTGRLRDRIEFLRRDCIEGLGEADFREACKIIDNQTEENVERALVELMGRVNFEKYGGKIWQLKFCETFKRS